jgi:hypothetical protein
VPIRNSAYFIPPIFIALQALSGKHGFVRRVFLLGGITCCLSLLSMSIDSLGGQNINLPGLFLGILTYSTLAVMLGMRADFTITSAHWQQIRTFVSWFVIVQSVLGVLQFAASGMSDAVCGTFGLFDFLGGNTIGQVYLTFNLFAMILFLLTDTRGRLVKTAIAAGLVACALAHSGHQTMFLMAALLIVGLLQARLKHLIRLGIAFSAILALTATVSTIDWTDAENWYQRILLDDDSPKKMVALGGADIMSSPKNLLLGVGIGQFGSRAALITEGHYLKTQLPAAFIGESGYHHKFFAPGDNAFEDLDNGSALSKRYCSALNFIVEFGLPLTLLLLVAIATQFQQNRRLSRSTDQHTSASGIMANVGLLFFVMCCFVENYAEFPQAIFLPTLLYVAARSPIAAEVNGSNSQSIQSGANLNGRCASALQRDGNHG